jgi:integrase
MGNSGQSRKRQSFLTGAAKQGIKEAPTRISEQRKLEADRRKAEQEEAERNDREAITLKTFFEEDYLPIARADKKPKSVVREEGLFRLWIDPAIGAKPMKDIAPFDLERLKNSMAKEGQSPRSIEYCLAVIRQIFNTAKRLKKYSGENPTSDIKFPKPDNQKMRFLTHSEADLLLSTLQEKSKDTHDMTLLALYCGLRQGEILSLQWQDVNLEKGILTIRDAKAGSRIAFLTAKTSAMLESRKAMKNDSDLVFPGRKGQMERISHTFWRTVEDLGFNKGVTDPRLKVTFHSCRHTYASWLVEAEQDLYIVQKLLGHKTNQMTMRYSHVGENQFRAAVNALETNLNKPEAGQVVNFPK